MKKLLFAAAATLLLVAGCKNEPPAIPVQSVTVSPDEITLAVGAGQQLTATVLPENASAKEVVWSSSAEAVATVSQDGTVTAVAAGLAIIKASCGGKEGECTVSVSLVEVTPGVLFNEDFEGGMPSGWTRLDADGDGYNWVLSTESGGSGKIGGHNGSDACMISQSYHQSMALTPDNYLFTPAIALPAGQNVLSAWLCAQDASYANEHFGIGICTVDPSGLTASNVTEYTTLFGEWDMTPAPLHPGSSSLRAQGNWYEYTFDLSDYSGQTVYLFFRHFNCTDLFYLNLDDVKVYTSADVVSAPAAPKSVNGKPAAGKGGVALRGKKIRK